MAIQETQLGQLRPSTTSTTSIYSPAANTTGVIRTFNVTNTTAIASPFRLFLDIDGTTYDESTALLWDINVDPGEVISMNVFWPLDNSSGNIAARVFTPNSLTFTLSGFEVT